MMSVVDTSRDRRQAPRVVFCDPIEIVGDETRLRTRALDVSTGGISIDDDSLEEGTQVRVRFSLGDATRRVDTVARVVRCDHGATGLAFENLAWTSRANLQDYVSAVRQGTSYPPSVWH